MHLVVPSKCFIVLQLITLSFCKESFELSLLSQDIDSRFKELYQQESSLCSHNALQDFISECSLKGADKVSPKLRTQSAVRLSICEFEEAHVEYPERCLFLESNEDFDLCVQDFSNSPQLWTTYSGHYGRLRSICYEEAIPFMKRDILNTFFNVTKIYTDFQSSALRNSGKAQRFHDEILAKFETILDLMNDSIVTQERRKRRDDEIVDDLHQSMLEKSDLVGTTWDRAATDISISLDQFDRDLSEAKNKLEMLLGYVDEQFSNILAANENLAMLHFRASQSISNDLSILSIDAKSGLVVLQELLDESLRKGSQINYLLYDTHLRVENIFDDVERESRAILTNVTRELRDEAFSIFMVLQTGFENSFIQLRHIGQKVGQTVLNMDAVSVGLDSNLAVLQERVTDLKHLNVGSIFNSISLSIKSCFCVFTGLSLMQLFSGSRHQIFVLAIVVGALAAILGKTMFTRLTLWN